MFIMITAAPETATITSMTGSRHDIFSLVILVLPVPPR